MVAGAFAMSGNWMSLSEKERLFAVVPITGTGMFS
jgi:hypothetical protein